MRGFAAICIALLGGCADPELILVFDLRTDLVPGIEFQSVRTIIETGDDSGTFVDVEAVEGMDFVTGQRIAELTGLSPGRMRLRVEAQTEAGTVVATRPVSVTLTESLGVTVVLSRACQGITCPLPEGDPLATACLGSVCGDDECTVENPEACGTPECVDDAGCAVGPSCTTPICSAGVCLLRTDSTLCAAEEFCDPDSGCRPVVNARYPAEVYLRMVEERLTTGVTRRIADETLVGDMMLSEVGPNQYDFVVRGARLEDSAPTGEPSLVEGTAFFEADGRWLMDPSSSAESPVVVFVTVDGLRWTFDNDLSDPRSDPAFGEYVIAEVADPPVRDQVGAWNAVSYVEDGTTHPADACVMDMGGGSTILSLALDVDENNITSFRESVQNFSDTSCMTSTTTDPWNLVGFAVQEGDDTVSAYLWDRTGGAGFHYRYTYMIDAGGSMTFTTTACVPAGCADFADSLTFDPR